MSWYVNDPTAPKAADHFDHSRNPARKGHAKAKVMMHPDDLHKIALLLVAGSAAAVCIFTLRILAAGLGG